MSGFNFSGFNQNNNNDLWSQLQKYLPPQTQDNIPNNSYSPANNYSGKKVYEIRNQDELTYIKPDDTGQEQIIKCDNDKTIIVAKYNYLTQKPDYEKYIFEGNINLFKNQDSSEEMGLITKALTALLDEIKNMNTEIQAIKNAPPKEIIKEVQVPVEVIKEVVREVKSDDNRDASGKFKKKGA